MSSSEVVLTAVFVVKRGTPVTVNSERLPSSSEPPVPEKRGSLGPSESKEEDEFQETKEAEPARGEQVMLSAEQQHDARMQVLNQRMEKIKVDQARDRQAKLQLDAAIAVGAQRHQPADQEARQDPSAGGVAAGDDGP